MFVDSLACSPVNNNDFVLIAGGENHLSQSKFASLFHTNTDAWHLQHWTVASMHLHAYTQSIWHTKPPFFTLSLRTKNTRSHICNELTCERESFKRFASILAFIFVSTSLQFLYLFAVPWTEHTNIFDTCAHNMEYGCVCVFMCANREQTEYIVGYLGVYIGNFIWAQANQQNRHRSLFLSSSDASAPNVNQMYSCL